jgi:hypothetical protein
MQAAAVLAGVAAGAIGIANSVTNLVENAEDGTANGWNIASNVLGIVGGVLGPIGGIAGTAENVVVQGISKGISVFGGLETATSLALDAQSSEYQEYHAPVVNAPIVPTKFIQGESNVVPNTATFGSSLYGGNTHIYSKNSMFGKYDML